MLRRDLLIKGSALGALPLVSSTFVPGLVRAQEAGNLIFVTPFGYSLSFSAVMYGQAGGFYAEEGLDVHVEGGRGAAQAVQLVAADQAGAARTGGANYMIARVENDAPVQAFATIAQDSPFFIISPNSAPIVAPSDFVGRTVGMASLGGSMEATLNLMLQRNEIDPAEVNRERVADTPAAFGLIEAERLDGFFGNVSTATRLLAEGYDINASPVDDGIPGQVYVASDEDIANNADQLVAFTRGTYRAIQDILGRGEDLEPVIATMRDQYDIPGSEETEVAVQDLYANSRLWIRHGEDQALRCNPEHWAEGEALLRQAGLITSEADQPLYTNAIWDRAVSG